MYTRPDTFPPLIKNLIIINVLVFLAQMMLDKQFSLTSKLMLWPLHTPEFAPYQLATHMFSHGGIGHIFFNMFTLFIFGRILENVWGPQRLLLFYLACGLGAAALHLGIQAFRYEQAVSLFESGEQARALDMVGNIGPMLGASGAIMGVMAAFAYLFPNTELYLMFIPIPVKAKWAILGYVAIDLFGGVASIRGDNIAHFAHLGGAITGFILVLIWNKTNRKRFY